LPLNMFGLTFAILGIKRLAILENPDVL